MAKALLYIVVVSLLLPAHAALARSHGAGKKKVVVLNFEETEAAPPAVVPPLTQEQIREGGKSVADARQTTRLHNILDEPVPDDSIVDPDEEDAEPE